MDPCYQMLFEMRSGEVENGPSVSRQRSLSQERKNNEDEFLSQTKVYLEKVH